MGLFRPPDTSILTIASLCQKTCATYGVMPVPCMLNPSPAYPPQPPSAPPMPPLAPGPDGFTTIGNMFQLRSMIEADAFSRRDGKLTPLLLYIRTGSRIATDVSQSPII
eukprot:4477996-Prymnesium_polylepis.2